MTERLEFTVLGRPQPAGSKKVVTAGGKPGGRPMLVEDAKRSKPWQAVVTAIAFEEMHAREQLAGPLLLEVDFYLARPRGHYGTGRNFDKLKPSAPRYPAVKPDATKLIRAVEDAITAAGVWRDDAQIVTQVVRKRYGHPERAEVLVATIAPSLDEVDERLATAAPQLNLRAEF